MKHTRSKKPLALMLSILMVISIIPLSAFTAFADTAVMGITLPKSYVEMSVDGKITVEASVYPNNATDKTVEYTSSDKNVAEVNEKGEITAKNEGIATITAKSKDGNFTDTVTVKVIKNLDTQITVNFYTETSNNATTFDSQIIGNGNKVLRPATNPTKEGYVFGGWYENTSFSNVWDFDTETVSRSFGMGNNANRKSLYARWINQSEYNAVTSVTLDKTEIKADIASGTALSKIKAIVAPNTAQIKLISWKSSDESVVSITSKSASTDEATLSFNKAGTATITATTDDGAKTATCTVTVEDSRVISLSQTAISADLKDGVFTYELSASITPDTATLGNLKWTSSDESVATVRTTQTGKATVTIHKAGNATITAEDKGKSASCALTITDTRVLALDKTTVSADLADGVFTYELSASVTPEGAQISNLKWTSSDESVATVRAGQNNKATVTINKAGTFTVTAEDKGKSVSCTFTITDTRTITLSNSSITTSYKGKNINLAIFAVVAPNKDAVKNLKRTSSDESVATVKKGEDNNAELTIRKAGTATITVEDAGKTATCTITAIDALIKEFNILITPPIAGQAPATTATINTDKATIESIKWPENVTTFTGGQTYEVTIALKANDDYTFPAITSGNIDSNYNSLIRSFKINGNNVSAIKDYSEGLEDTTISVTYSFRAVAAHTHIYSEIINAHDDTHHFKACIDTNCPDPFKGAIEKAAHTPATEYKTDANNHWNDCSCRYKANFGPHTPNEDDGNCLTAIICSVCNAVTTEAKTAHEDADNDGKCDVCGHSTAEESDPTTPDTESSDTSATEPDSTESSSTSTDSTSTDSTSTDSTGTDSTGADSTDTDSTDTDSTDPDATESEITESDPAEEDTSATDATTALAPTNSGAKKKSGCGGCGSSASLTALAIFGVIGTAVVIKKKED